MGANDELMKKEFEEFANEGECRRGKENSCKAGSKWKTCNMEPRLRFPSRGRNYWGGLEQTIDAGGEIAVTSQEGNGEKRQARSRTHAGDMHERGSERNGTAGISRSSL